MKLLYGNSLICKLRFISAVLVYSLYLTTSSIAQTKSVENIDLEGLVFISPNFSATETWTNNISPGNSTKKSGSISEISPGINIRIGTGKVKGYLNYSLNFFNYNGEQNRTSIQNSLNSSTVVEVIDGHGFIDVNGFISQQTISAFSIQTNSLTSNSNTNKTEVSTYSLSPYYRGNLSNLISYEARYRLGTTQAKNADNFSSTDSLASLSLNGDKFFGKLSWTLEANHQVISKNTSIKINANGNTEIDRLNLTLNYPLSNQLLFSVSGGQEQQNYTSAEKESSWTSGAGLNWSLSEMTKVSANLQRNPLGKMHSLNFEHRTARTSWKISDVKSVSLSNSKLAPSLGNNYDLLFNQFASIESDPIKRAQLVNNYLQINGINPISAPINGYLTSTASLQRSQNISFALLGVRDTITVTAAKSIGRSIGNSILLTDDFNSSNFIKQNGISLAYTHRLTENTVISNQFSLQRIRGEISTQNSELKSANITASTRLGPKINLTISARHSISSSSSFPYKETALIGNLALQF